MAILKRAMGGSRKSVSMADGSQFTRGWGGISPGMFGHYTSETYASAYPSIRAISAEYMAVMPYAIDANGKPVDNPVIDALFHPNQEDSVVSFSEKIAVSTLVRPKTYILVWRKDGRTARPGGNFRKDTIAGFTFLERPAIQRRDGHTFYQVGEDVYNENEVIVLPGGVDPMNLYAGYSPSEAARRWVKLDDYIADYQAGFFENGAVPAGLFTVTAATGEDYNDTVDMLESKHRGAGKNNNITYSHKLINESGSTVANTIEWTPFAQSNKDIDFKNLFDQTNRRIDTAYGVSQIIKGVDDAATYANAQVAVAGFSKRAVYPLLLRNYTQITHELNRITGGLGVSIAFNYDIPAVADEEKVVAETNNVRVATISQLLALGYSLESIANALELPATFKLLSKTDEPLVIENDKPEVDEGNEVANSPDPDDVGGTYYVRSVKSEEAKSTNPKAHKTTKATDDELTDEERLENVARGYLDAQVDRVISDLDGNGVEDILLSNIPDPTQEEMDVFVSQANLVVISILASEGVTGRLEAIKLATANGVPADTVEEFILSDTVKNAYEEYLKKVALSYGTDTGNSIRQVLSQANINELSRDQIARELRKIPGLDEYRVKRLAVTELNHSTSLAKIEAFEQLAEQTDTQWEKSLYHRDTPKDQFCLATIGVYVPLKTSYLPVGGSIVGTEGGILVNDFADNEAWGIHPNCKGIPQFRIVK